jgi:hypothetical protein
MIKIAFKRTQNTFKSDCSQSFPRETQLLEEWGRREVSYSTYHFEVLKFRMWNLQSIKNNLKLLKVSTNGSDSIPDV